MARDFFTMDDFDLSGRTVLLRVDINSPIDPATGELLNDARIREHLLTIRELRGAKVALLAHQSRPGRDDFTTLEVHAERIAALLGRPVRAAAWSASSRCAPRRSSSPSGRKSRSSGA